MPFIYYIITFNTPNIRNTLFDSNDNLLFRNTLPRVIYYFLHTKYFTKYFLKELTNQGI